jgi:hypothetical protein
VSQENTAGAACRPLRVLVFSSDNPDGAFLAAGLLHGRPRDFSAVVLRGIGASLPSPEVARVLEEAGGSLPDGALRQAGGTAPEAIHVAVAICTPT